MPKDKKKFRVIIILGESDQDHVAFDMSGVCTKPSYSPYRLVSQSAMLQEMAVHGTNERPIVLSMIPGSYFRREGV